MLSVRRFVNCRLVRCGAFNSSCACQARHEACRKIKIIISSKRYSHSSSSKRREAEIAAAMKTSFCVTREAAQLLLNTHTISFITNNLWFHRVDSALDNEKLAGVAWIFTQVNHKRWSHVLRYQRRDVSLFADLVLKAEWLFFEPTTSNSGSSSRDENQICCGSRSFSSLLRWVIRWASWAHEGEIVEARKEETKRYSFKISRVFCLIEERLMWSLRVNRKPTHTHSWRLVSVGAARIRSWVKGRDLTMWGETSYQCMKSLLLLLRRIWSEMTRSRLALSNRNRSGLELEA